MIDFTHYSTSKIPSLDKVLVNKNFALLIDREQATEEDIFPLEISSEDDYYYWDNFDSFSQFDEEMSQKTPSYNDNSNSIPTVHNHHSDPPIAISINSTKSPSKLVSTTSPQKLFKTSNDDESTCASMPKLISRMNDDDSCTTTTSIDSSEDTANRPKPNQPTPTDKFNCESMPKLTSHN